MNKKKIKIIFFFIIFLIIISLFIEITVQYLRPSWHERDGELGWILKKNLNHSYDQIDESGVSYKAHIIVNKNNFRIFNEKKNRKNLKILIIGDSFTADPYVSDNKMWFSVMAQNLNKKFTDYNFEIYATGGGGYGTIQEYILTKRILNKKFVPDIFILQFCSNDFRNNSYAIEKRGIVLNQFFRRPYIDENDKIIYSQEFLAKLSRAPLFGSSRIFNKLLHFYATNLRSIENYKIKEAEKQEAEIITNRYLNKISSLMPNVPKFICFCEKPKQFYKYNSIFLSKKNNFIPLTMANDLILKNKKNKNIFFYDRSHFNNLGNKIFGEGIYSEIKSKILTFIEQKQKRN